MILESSLWTLAGLVGVASGVTYTNTTSTSPNTPAAILPLGSPAATPYYGNQCCPDHCVCDGEYDVFYNCTQEGCGNCPGCQSTCGGVTVTRYITLPAVILSTTIYSEIYENKTITDTDTITTTTTNITTDVERTTINHSYTTTETDIKNTTIDYTSYIRTTDFSTKTDTKTDSISLSFTTTESDTITKTVDLSFTSTETDTKTLSFSFTSTEIDTSTDYVSLSFTRTDTVTTSVPSPYETTVNVTITDDFTSTTTACYPANLFQIPIQLILWHRQLLILRTLAQLQYLTT
jgi:hypothetical protein